MMLRFIPHSAGIAEIKHAPTGRKLIVTMYAPLGAGSFKCHAFETDIDANTLDAIFGDHSHVVISESDPWALAIAKSNAYARRWLGEKQRADRCACEPIE